MVNDVAVAAGLLASAAVLSVFAVPVFEYADRIGGETGPRGAGREAVMRTFSNPFVLLWFVLGLFAALALAVVVASV